MTERPNPRPAPGGVHIEPAPHLMGLADEVAVALHRDPDRRLGPAQVLGIAKMAGGMLTAAEKHNLFGLVTIHDDIEPLEDGRFTLKEDVEPDPEAARTIRAHVAENGSNGNGNGRALSAQEIARLLHDMRTDPDMVKARADKRRIANPRGRSRVGSRA